MKVALLPEKDLIQYISFDVKILVHKKLTPSDKIWQTLSVVCVPMTLV